jgi:putative drug exporter of the RND superfamily
VTTLSRPQGEQPPPSDTYSAGARDGLLGRLGRWSFAHFRTVSVVWLMVVVSLGVFAPHVTSALSGAGWQANGSASVKVRELARKHFDGDSSSALQVVVTSQRPIADPAVQQVIGKVARVLKADPRISDVVPPQPGATISRDGHTAVVLGGAKAGTEDMVRAAGDLKGPLRRLSSKDVSVRLTGQSAVFSDFNDANFNAMIKAEVVSWPVTLAIMVIAFGSLVAAGLPLLLTLAGLVAAAGSLVLIAMVTPLSIWAMDFAMIFALALGIDYALFLVIRFRTALRRSGDRSQAIAETMDSAGRAVLVSGLTVLVSLLAVTLVPVPTVRTMAVGIVLAVAFVLTATLTLLPGVLATLGHRVNNLTVPWARTGEQSSVRFAAWGERLWRQPLRFGALGLAVLIALSVPLVGLKTAMPSITVVPHTDSSRQGYETIQRAFGPGAPGTLQIIAPESQAAAVADRLGGFSKNGRIAAVLPAQRAADGSGLVLIRAVPSVGPSDPSLPGTVKLLRAQLPDQALVGGAAVENIDLQTALDDRAPLVIALILALGFVLLFFAFQAPLLAALATLTNLLATTAVFGMARLIFQDGIGAGLLGFTSQGFVDAWAPVFFFAVIFAISMDYTVFLLSVAKEHYELTGNPRTALVGGLSGSGRMISTAGGVMVAVFFTFGLAGQLPPKEMGIVLGLAVLVDTVLVRLLVLPVLLRLSGQAAWWSPFGRRSAAPLPTGPVPDPADRSGGESENETERKRGPAATPLARLSGWPLPEQMAQSAPVEGPQGDGARRWRGAGILFGPIAGAIAVVAMLGAGAYAFSADGKVCQGTGITLQVAVAPEIEAAVSRAAWRFGNERHRVDDACVTAVVNSADPAQATTMLGQGTAVGVTHRPDVWIPDSSLWTALIPASGPGNTVTSTGASIARSPLVAGLPHGLADTLRGDGVAAERLSWRDLLRGAGALNAGKGGAGGTGQVIPQNVLHLQVPDPVRNASGLGSLMIANALLAKDPDQRVAFTSMARTLRGHTTSDVAAEFAALKPDQQGSYPVVIVPEQAVFAYNQRNAANPVLAVYPREGTLSLDYPYAVTTGDGQKVKAARLLETALGDEATRNDLRALGFRAGGGASPAASGSQVAADPVSLPVPAPADVRKVVQNWYKLSRGIRNLTLVDVSASMDEPAGPGLTRLQVATQAAQIVLGMLPDDTQIGVWSSSNPFQGAHGEQVNLPIGRLSDQVGKTARRQQLLNSLGRMHVEAAGSGTGLDDSLLSAFRMMTRTYSAKQVNSIIVYTAGQHDNSKISQQDLVAALRREYDPARPVQILMVGIGDGVDRGELDQIAKATHGSAYTVTAPQQMQKIVFNALSRRVCTPNC